MTSLGRKPFFGPAIYSASKIKIYQLSPDLGFRTLVAALASSLYSIVPQFTARM